MSASRPNRPTAASSRRTLPPTRPPVDRIANWLADRPRPVRMLIALLISGALTITISTFLYGLLVGTDATQLPLAPQTFSTILLIISVIAGIAFYWVGWRVMLGFDFEDKPLRPGRAAALWLIIGVIILILTVFGILSSSLAAIQD